MCFLFIGTEEKTENDFKFKLPTWDGVWAYVLTAKHKMYKLLKVVTNIKVQKLILWKGNCIKQSWEEYYF